MKNYLVKTPFLIKKLFPKLAWKMPTKEKEIYLTFDDGPIPIVTEWVLDELKKHNAKATFFCIGDNIKKHPKIFKRVLEEEHAIGNHTQNHLNARKVPHKEYIDNFLKAESTLNNPECLLFRPPYGRLTWKTSSAIRKKGYKIIMWDVLSADFDTSITKEECLKNVLENVTAGSIVVFHDSLKVQERLKYALPKVLESLGKEGFVFKAITS